MSEYRPGVTSPHTLSQRWAHPCPRSLPSPHPTYPVSALLLALFRPILRARALLLPRSVGTSNVALLYRSLTPLLPACSLDFSLSRPARFFPRHPPLSLS